MKTTKLSGVRVTLVSGALGVLALVVGCTNGGGSATGSTSSASSTCSGWAQTGQCLASGPREPQNDKPCGEDLDPGWSGYCQCAGGDVGMDCGHVVISCDDTCQVASQPAGSCIGWKQTSDCASTGPREDWNDQDAARPRSTRAGPASASAARSWWRCSADTPRSRANRRAPSSDGLPALKRASAPQRPYPVERRSAACERLPRSSPWSWPSVSVAARRDRPATRRRTANFERRRFDGAGARGGQWLGVGLGIRLGLRLGLRIGHGRACGRGGQAAAPRGRRWGAASARSVHGAHPGGRHEPPDDRRRHGNRRLVHRGGCSRRR